MLDSTSAANATFEVEETVKGISAMTSYMLSLEGVPSPPINMDATAQEVGE